MQNQAQDLRITRRTIEVEHQVKTIYAKVRDLLFSRNQLGLRSAVVV